MHTLTQLSLLAEKSPRSLPASTGLSSLPWPVRFAIADVFAQIHVGEEAALHCIRRVLSEDPLGEARTFAGHQLADERRHVSFFADSLWELRVKRPAMPGLVDLFDKAKHAPDLPRLLLANHLVVETLAHAIFRDLEKLLGWLGRRSWLWSSWRDVFRELSSSLHWIVRDESRHVAFGVLRLKALREQLSEVERLRLDGDAREWGVLLERVLKALPVFFPLKPWLRARTRRILTQFRQRCLDAGVTL
jgi:hypothetical protein